MDIRETLYKEIVDTMSQLEVSEESCGNQVVYDPCMKALYYTDTVFLLASGELRVLAYSENREHTFILYKNELSLDFLDWLLNKVTKILEQEQQKV